MKRMKKFFALLLAATMVASMAACAGSSTPAANGESSVDSGSESTGDDGSEAPTKTDDEGLTPKEGGILVIAQSASPAKLDPVDYTGTYEGNIIAQVCDTVVDMSQSGEVIPSLATKWEVDDTGMIYTFTLRDDVYFHPGEYQDGRKMTAEDVKYSLERSNELSANSRIRIDHCEVVDDTHVKVYLPAPSAAFLTTLTDEGNSIVPKEEVEGWGDEFGAHLVGTGAFMMKSFSLDNKCELVRNDNYWAAKPYLDGVTFTVVTEAEQALNGLQSGDIDMTALSGESIKLAREDKNLTVLEMEGLQFSYIYFNMVNGPTADKNVRKALIMGVSREDLCNAIYLYNSATPADLPLPPGSWGYDASLEDLVPDYDPEGAKALLADAGYADGLDLDFYTSDSKGSVDMATVAQAEWQQIGVNIDIKTSEWGTFSEYCANGQCDMFAMSWTWYSDPYFFLNYLFHSSHIGSQGNGQGFNVPEVDELLNKAETEPVEEERAKLYQQALKLIVEEYPQIDYANRKNIIGFSSRVHGFSMSTDNAYDICSTEANVWLAE